MDLTVIIPVLNDKDELMNTINSILETNLSSIPKIIVIDDASTDGLSYSEFANSKLVKYIRNTQQRGSTFCRDLGVENCDTKYFIHIDAHMRFKTLNWGKKIISILKKNPNSFLCLTCLGITKDRMDLDSAPKYYGADLLYKEFDGFILKEFLEPKWREPDDDVLYEIPIMMGACYASSKTWYKEIGGLEGLKFWGCEESFLSLKTWMFGGKCILSKDIEVGHIFRDFQPYTTHPWAVLYNRLFIIKTLLGVEEYEKILKELPISNSLKIALKEISENKSISLKKQGFSNKIKFNFDDYCKKFKVIGYGKT